MSTTLLVGASIVVVLAIVAWMMVSTGESMRGHGGGVRLRTGRGWGPGRVWRSRYPGAVGYPIAGYPVWLGGATPCVIKCADQLADCNAVSPGNPLCDVMYRSCAADC